MRRLLGRLPARGRRGGERSRGSGFCGDTERLLRRRLLKSLEPTRLLGEVESEPPLSDAAMPRGRCGASDGARALPALLLLLPPLGSSWPCDWPLGSSWRCAAASSRSAASRRNRMLALLSSRPGVLAAASCPLRSASSARLGTLRARRARPGAQARGRRGRV